MQTPDSQKIIERFFFVLHDMISNKYIRGKQTFTREYKINRWNFNTVEKDHSRDIFQMAWLAYLINYWGISSKWLMSGDGEMYITDKNGKRLIETIIRERKKIKAK